MLKNIKDILKKTPFMRVICFLIILFLVISLINKTLLYRDRNTDNSSYQVVNFYKEKEGDMDLVFVGSSSCFSFYSPLFAYNAYGIKTTNFASSGMGMIAFKHVVEEIQKTQKGVPIIITLSAQDVMNYTSLHYLADYMPLTSSKINLIKAFFAQDGESMLNSVEYFFPLMRFHERWSTLTMDDLVIDDGTKGATRHIYYLSYIYDITDNYHVSDERLNMPKEWLKYISECLDYADSSNIELMFIVPPKAYKDDDYKMLNSAKDYIQNRGYDVLDMRDELEEIGLDMTYDFYDIYHTNIHGSVKYTDYVINKLIDKYNIKAKEKHDQSFNNAFEKYYEFIKDYVIKEELDMINRDYYLERPEFESIQKTDLGVLIKWKHVENADGYIIYKRNNNVWMRIDDIEETEYCDTNFNVGKNEYTVFSYRIQNSKKLLGNYDYRGTMIEVYE